MVTPVFGKPIKHLLPSLLSRVYSHDVQSPQQRSCIHQTSWIPKKCFVVQNRVKLLQNSVNVTQICQGMGAISNIYTLHGSLGNGGHFKYICTLHGSSGNVIHTTHSFIAQCLLLTALSNAGSILNNYLERIGSPEHRCIENRCWVTVIWWGGEGMQIRLL